MFESKQLRVEQERQSRQAGRADTLRSHGFTTTELTPDAEFIQAFCQLEKETTYGVSFSLFHLDRCKENPIRNVQTLQSADGTQCWSFDYYEARSGPPSRTNEDPDIEKSLVAFRQPAINFSPFRIHPGGDSRLLSWLGSRNPYPELRFRCQVSTPDDAFWGKSKAKLSREMVELLASGSAASEQPSRVPFIFFAKGPMMAFVYCPNSISGDDLLPSTGVAGFYQQAKSVFEIASKTMG